MESALRQARFCLMLQRKHYTDLSSVIKSSGAAKDLTTKKGEVNPNSNFQKAKALAFAT